MTAPYIRHEEAILELLQRWDAGQEIDDALHDVAPAHGLQPARLRHLATLWCSIAGVPSPFTEPVGFVTETSEP